MYRTYEERNHNNWKKSVRKKKIADSIYPVLMHDKDGVPIYHPWYSNLHQYSKNKIHCSCPLCRRKTNNRGNYGRAYNPSVHDTRQILKGDDIA